MSKYRYCKWWRIEARERGELTWRSWGLEPLDADDAERWFWQYVRDRGSTHYIRLLLVGPREYDHAVREVRGYHEPRED